MRAGPVGSNAAAGVEPGAGSMVPANTRSRSAHAVSSCCRRLLPTLYSNPLSIPAIPWWVWPVRLL